MKKQAKKGKKKKDGRSKTSAINGQYGGRPIASATLISQSIRNYIATALEIELGPIVKESVRRAKKGERYSRDWLIEHGIGKAKQALDVKGNLSISELLNKLSNE